MSGRHKLISGELIATTGKWLRPFVRHLLWHCFLKRVSRGKSPPAETASVAGESTAPGDLPRDASKRQECDFGHPTSCFHRKPRRQLIALSNLNEAARLSPEPNLFERY